MIALPAPPPPPYIAPDIHPIAANDTAYLDIWTNRKGAVVESELNAGIWLAAEGAPLEIRSHKDTDASTSSEQAFYDSGDREDARASVAAGAMVEPIPSFDDAPLGSLPDFVSMEIRDGRTVRYRAKQNLCNENEYWDGAGMSRLDRPDSPENVTFVPASCNPYEPYQLGTVIGLDRGWSNRASLTAPTVKLQSGDYSLTVMFNPKGSVSESDYMNNAVTVPLVVRRHRGSQNFSPEGLSAAARHRKLMRDARKRARMSAAHAPDFRLVPSIPTPPPAAVDVPDLRSAPSFGISVDREGKKDLLSFGALTWNEGPGRLEVEAFRESGTTLQAYQVFYDGWVRAARQPRGAVIWHAATGHNHFHFQAFARYRLLNDAMSPVRDSGKTSWCIVDTNVVDSSLPGFDAGARGNSGIGNCGADSGALWARLSLSVGAGDLYQQSVAGQAFDITSLPNGTYHIEITANPDDILAEGDYSNNTSLREITLSGKAGKRRVTVTPDVLVDDNIGEGF